MGSIQSIKMKKQYDYTKMCEFKVAGYVLYQLPAYQNLQMEIPYVGCDSEQSARHRCLFSASLWLHVCWLEVTLVEKDVVLEMICSCTSSVSRGWEMLWRIQIPPRPPSAAASGVSVTLYGLILLPHFNVDNLQNITETIYR